MFAEYWLMAPVGLLISTIAMFSGLGGGVLWMPFLLVSTELQPREAVVATLIIQFFGQASASITNGRSGLIHWKLVQMMVIVGIPAVVIGVLLASLLHPLWIEFLLGLTIFFIAYVFLRGDDFFVEGSPAANLEAAGRGRPITMIGGILTGFIGIGVGDWLVPFFNKQCRLTMLYSVASSIAIMMVLSVTALTVHLFFGVRIAWPIVLPSIVGVIAGAQLGSRLLRRVPEIHFKELFVLMLIFIATHVSFNAF